MYDVSLTSAKFEAAVSQGLRQVMQVCTANVSAFNFDDPR